MGITMNDNYFLSKGFEKRGEDIYVYSNFISQDQLKIINAILDKIRINADYNPLFAGTYFEKRITKEIEELKFLPKKIKDLFKDYYIVHEHIAANILSEGDLWLEHYDAKDFMELREISKTLKEGDKYKIVEDSHYGIVAYFNHVENGGELVYTNQGITYSPKPGDLVVHSAEENCMHLVNKVLKGHRYSYSNNLRVELKVPV
jgi:hypothetical protein